MNRDQELTEIERTFWTNDTEITVKRFFRTQC
jgi:hypothetical protein